MSPILIFAELIAIVFLGQVSGQWTATPFNPPALPLAVRTPYLNAWLEQGKGAPSLNGVFPQFRDQSFIDWYAAVKVDGQTCRITGGGGDGSFSGNQTAMEFTPTRTSFLFQCFTVNVNATFLTPIFAKDLVRQSMPFSYFYLQASSNDGHNHNISMYSHIGSDLITGLSTQVVDVNPPDIGDSHIILSMQLQNPPLYPDVGLNGNALDASAFYGMKTDSFPAEYSWQISPRVASRATFADSSVLSNTTTTPPGNFESSDDPVSATSVNYGEVGSTPNTVWSVGVPRNPVVQYATSNGETESRHPYYLSDPSFPNELNAMQFFLADFDTGTLSTSIELDLQLQSDAGKISPEYANLIALVARQALGAMDITIAQNSDGSWDTSDVKAFMDNTGNVGSTPGVNVVDIIYASLPAYLYFNPDLAAYLLRPLLDYQDSSQYQLPYAARSIGSAYPNATADAINQPHQLGVEETANMIIMTLAYAQRSGNGTLISKHYSLLRRWADYLVGNALAPVNQASPDFSPILYANGLPTSNSTNVALKGIIGIAAMGKISLYAGVQGDASNLTSIAQQYIQQWTDLSVSSDNSHLLMTYGTEDSEALVYNLYADKLLQLGLVPDNVYETHTAFIDSQISSSLIGIPLDNNNISIGTIGNTSLSVLFSRTDWMMFSAAVSTTSTTRNAIIAMVHTLASSNHSSSPFCVEFESQTGICVGGSVSPAQAGLFALLAMNQNIVPSISFPQDGTTIPGLTPHKKSHAGAIAGGIVGGLAALAVIAGVDRYFRRRRMRQVNQRLRQRDYYNLEGLKKDRSSL